MVGAVVVHHGTRKMSPVDLSLLARPRAENREHMDQLPHSNAAKSTS